MPPEEALHRTFQALSSKEKKWFADDMSLSSVIPSGMKAVAVLDSPATLSGRYALARRLHRETWIRRPGVCAPKRHGEPGCVLFPTFPMTAGSNMGKPCSLSHEKLQEAAAIAEQDNLADPERCETFLLKWEEPYVQPWWTPRTLTHDEPRHLVMFKTALVRYPWMTHFVKQDLDTYPYYPFVLQGLVKAPEGKAAQTGHVYFGQWHRMGTWPGKRNPDVKTLHRLSGDCKIPQGQGGHEADRCKDGVHSKDWQGNFVSVDFHKVNDAWCNDWAMKDYEKGCWRPYDRGWGLCSGFMYGQLWALSRSLTQAIVDSQDKYINSVFPEDYGHSDIRAGAWVNRIALKANQSVELRALCGNTPWHHFGR